MIRGCRSCLLAAESPKANGQRRTVPRYLPFLCTNGGLTGIQPKSVASLLECPTGQKERWNKIVPVRLAVYADHTEGVIKYGGKIDMIF